MNKQALLALVQANREAPPEHFDMTAIFNRGLGGCKTPACVLGNYIARSDLQQVFTLEGCENCFKFCLITQPGEEIYYMDRAVQKHFDLTRNELHELFSADPTDNENETSLVSEATTPQEAADYILAFIARKEKENDNAE